MFSNILSLKVTSDGAWTFGLVTYQMDQKLTRITNQEFCNYSV